MKNTYAAIDIGTNSAHLVVVEADGPSFFRIVDTDKISLRLGEAFDSDGCIEPDAIVRTADAIKVMKSIADSYGARLRCAATHAMRIAVNQAEMRDQILAQTGVEVEIVDGVEEARLVGLGLWMGRAPVDEKILGIDIGGGSTELIVSDQESIDYATSIKLGAVVLTDRTTSGQAFRASDLKAVKRYISDHLDHLESEISSLEFSKGYLSSGTAKAVAEIDARLKKIPINDIHGYELSTKSIDYIYSLLRQLDTPEEIQKTLQISVPRSQILLAGCAILRAFTKMFRKTTWTVSSFGLREGLIIDTIERCGGTDTRGGPSLPRWQHIRWKSVAHLGRKFAVDESHASMVLRHALDIYGGIGDQLNPKNREITAYLDDREILRSAAWLHECGKYIEYPGYHKHSMYLIMRSRVMGFTQEEREIVGLVARYQRKGKARPNRRDFRHLSDEKIQRVNYLAAILRIAATLCRTRREAFGKIAVEVSGTNVTLVLESLGEVSAATELSRLDSQSEELSEMLGFEFSYRIQNQTT